MNAISKVWKSLTYLADAAHTLGDTLKEINAGVRQRVGLDETETPEPEAVETTNGNGRKRVTVK